MTDGDFPCHACLQKGPPHLVCCVYWHPSYEGKQPDPATAVACYFCGKRALTIAPGGQPQCMPCQAAAQTRRMRT